jgi:hypothetical protein
VDHPEHLKVMFGPYISHTPSHTDHAVHSVGNATFGKLVELVVTAQRVGLVRAGDPVEVSVSVWSMLHGFAMLMVQKQFDFLQLGPGRLAALAEQAAHDTLSAVRAPPPAPGRQSRTKSNAP